MERGGLNMEKKDLIKVSKDWRVIYKKEHYQIFLLWEDSKKSKCLPPIVKFISTEFINSCRTFQAVLSCINRFKGFRNIKDQELKSSLIKFIENTYIGEKKYPDLEELSIDFIDTYGRRANVTFDDEKMSDQELLDYVKECLINSDFKIDNYEPMDDDALLILDNEEEEEEEDDLEGWSDFALADGVWEETLKEDVISYLEKNYPDIELCTTTDGTTYGGRYGQDSLEFREDHLFIFRGKHSLFYDKIKSGDDIKKFIDKYL